MRDETILKTTEEELRLIITRSYSFPEVIKELGLNNTESVKSRLKRYIKKMGINYDHFTKTKKRSDDRWSKVNILKCVEGSKNYKDILIKLDLIPVTSSYTKLKMKLLEYDINFTSDNVSKRWGKLNVEKCVNQSTTYKETLIRLGVRAAGDNYKQLKKYIKLYNIDIIHFENTLIELNKTKYTLPEILVSGSTYSRSSLKKRLYNEGLKEKKCEMCGQGEEWRGKKMSLILDHINGVHNDNRIENLRILCPNCNSTLDTHAGKNNKNKNKKKKKKYFCNCGIEIHRNHKQCQSCCSKNKRKVDRPPLEQLIKEIEELGYCGTGRKYGVSDNAIRKWVI